jgi:hypothetical protein
MNTRKIFTAFFAAMLLLGCISEASARERKEHTYKRYSVGIPPELEMNSQIRPYLPQKNLVSLAESRSFCDFNGVHNTDTHRQTEYNCRDYRGADGLWRVIFGPGSVSGARLARKIFKQSGGNWVLLAEFDRDNQLVAESPSGTKLRISLGNDNNQNEPQQARENENSSPMRGIPRELKDLLPGFGTILGR